MMDKKRHKLYEMFFGGKSLSLIDYLYGSASDEIVEIDILHDTFRQIYHTKGKYFIPNLETSFVSLFDFALQGIVHPDDLEIFTNLMNPRDILDRLHNNKETPNFLMAHFRYRLQNGNWRWVEQCVITGKENNIDEGKIVVFIRDIENLKIREKGIANSVEDNGQYSGRDELTRLYRSDYFFEKAEEKMKANPKTEWCLISIDIDNFKLFDQWMGRKTGDLLLATIGNYILSLKDIYNCVGGYFGQDDFSILIRYDKKLIDEIYKFINGLTTEYGKSVGFAPAFGIYVIENGVSIKQAYDLASIATARAKKDIKNRIHFYDNSIQNEEENEFKILTEVLEAIQKDQITFYLQPQCRISSKKIVGAEALARWIKPNGEIVSPLRYIPILEKYSFISDLDIILWEKAIKWLRKWLDKGKKPVPISLNVSRSDIYSIDVCAHFIKLCKKYNIPHNLIKLEITESSYAETTEKVALLVKALRGNGFMVLMDDFGSGYSSLNVLKTLKIDAIKLDALFLNFENKEDDEKAIHILESVINMTKQLSLPMIVEGVETKEHVDFLEGMGCRYIQGYYFYKPLPIDEFEKIIEDEEIIDDRGILFKHNEQFRIQEFLDKNIYSDTMLNSILGPVAVYAWHDNMVDIVRYNEQFYKAVSTSDFVEKIENIQAVMPPEDAEMFPKILEEAVNNKLNGSNGILRFYKLDGTLTSFNINFFYLGERDGSKRFYGSARNVTNLADLRDQFNLISEYSNDSFLFVTRIDQKWRFEVISNVFSDFLGISRNELEEELNNGAIRRRIINQKEYDDFMLSLGNLHENYVDFTFDAEIKDKDGIKYKVKFKFNSVANKANNIKYVVFTDVIKEL